MLYLSPVIFILYFANSFSASGGWPWRTGNGIEIANNKKLINYYRTHFVGKGHDWNGWVNNTSGDTNPDFVLLGDSHAQMYLHGFNEEIIKNKGKSLYISSVSCLSLPGLYRLTTGHNFSKKCPETLNRTVQQLRGKKNSVLILAYYWPHQLKQSALTGKPKRLTFPGKEKGYEFTVGKIKELQGLIENRKIIVIGQAPGAMKIPFDCLQKPGADEKKCNLALSYNRFEALGYHFNQYFLHYFSKDSQVLFLNPYDVLCDAQVCPVIENGVPLYSDNHHLSKLGFDKEVDYFIDEINEFFK